MSTEKPRDTVVLLTNEDSVRREISATLKKAGFIVLTASNADSALHLCEEADPSKQLAIIDVGTSETSDMGTSQTNGREFLDRLCQVSPGIRVLFLSNTMAPDALEHLGRSVRKPCGVLRKPFRRAQLLGQVIEVMNQPLAFTA
jgi:CheY-like chemotaxis protein